MYVHNIYAAHWRDARPCSLVAIGSKLLLLFCVCVRVMWAAVLDTVGTFKATDTLANWKRWLSQPIVTELLRLVNDPGFTGQARFPKRLDLAPQIKRCEPLASHWRTVIRAPLAVGVAGDASGPIHMVIALPGVNHALVKDMFTAWLAPFPLHAALVQMAPRISAPLDTQPLEALLPLDLPPLPPTVRFVTVVGHSNGKSITLYWPSRKALGRRFNVERPAYGRPSPNGSAITSAVLGKLLGGRRDLTLQVICCDTSAKERQSLAEFCGRNGHELVMMHGGDIVLDAKRDGTLSSHACLAQAITRVCYAAGDAPRPSALAVPLQTLRDMSSTLLAAQPPLRVVLMSGGRVETVIATKPEAELELQEPGMDLQTPEKPQEPQVTAADVADHDHAVSDVEDVSMSPVVPQAGPVQMEAGLEVSAAGVGGALSLRSISASAPAPAAVSPVEASVGPACDGDYMEDVVGADADAGTGAAGAIASSVMMDPIRGDVYGPVHKPRHAGGRPTLPLVRQLSDIQCLEVGAPAHILARAAARGGHAPAILARMVYFSCSVRGREGRHVVGFLCKGQDGEVLEQHRNVMHDIVRKMTRVGTKIQVARADAAELATLSPRPAGGFAALQPASSHVFLFI